MAIVIGLDFGNFYSYPCFVQDSDLAHSRLGGRLRDLLPDNDNQGVPSVFFYNPADGTMLFGRAAVSGRARPEKNRVRYMKRHLGKPLMVDGQQVTVDGKPWTYDDAVRGVIEQIIRDANRILQMNYGETTNLVSIAYPVTYSVAQRQRLIEIVESATDAEGNRLQVFGTIAEPAAAALDYLADQGGGQNETILTYDLGGGTFDLALVSCYPGGRRIAGHTRYYEIHYQDGIGDLGGKEFDDILFGMIWGKIRERYPEAALTPRLTNELLNKAEQAKIELSGEESVIVECVLWDEEVMIPVSRTEFETAAAPLVQRTVDLVSRAVNDARLPDPQHIILTGGASQMPIVQRMLRESLPAYRERISFFRPSRAIGYGAARYGTHEDPTPVLKRTSYDIGIRYYRNREDMIGYISTVIPAGTELPFESEWEQGHTLQRGRYVSDRVYEARVTHPDANQIERDYRYVVATTVDFGRVVPEGTSSESRLLLDINGVLTEQSRAGAGAQLFEVRETLQDLT